MLECGNGTAVSHAGLRCFYSPDPVVAMARVWVRTVAAGDDHILALGWDGRVYSWGYNYFGQLGHGDLLDRFSPTLVDGFECVFGVAASSIRN
jgi:alpha-tubulin suppressor-like RCC1 family protein